MIHGIGTDIVNIARMRRLLDRHGEAFKQRLLAVREYPDFDRAHDPARLLAKRFAAKEAFAKAYGTGLRAPLLLPALAVVHDEFGRPGLAFDAAVTELLQARRLIAHLSLADEHDQAVAFVILEQACT